MQHDDTSTPPPGGPGGDGSNQTSDTTALEARIVAWVLGEASAFEIAELERLVAARPELAVFKRRIAAVHGLTGEATRPAPAGLKLSVERRAKLLATLGASTGEGIDAGAAQVEGGAEAAKAVPVVMTMPSPAAVRKRTPWWRSQMMMASAACVTVGIVAGWLVMFEAEQKNVSVYKTEEGPLLVQAAVAQGSQVKMEMSRAEALERKARVEAALGETEKRRAPAEAEPVAGELDRMRGVTMPSQTPDAFKADAAQVSSFRFFGGAAAPPQPPDVSVPPVAPVRDRAQAPVANTGGITFGGGGAGAPRVAQAPSGAPPADTIILTPFEVSTDKDVGYAAGNSRAGYAAGNTLSGGRVDTPLAITPGSVSVMTKEFMDNFEVNPKEQGAASIGFDLKAGAAPEEVNGRKIATPAPVAAAPGGGANVAAAGRGGRGGRGGGGGGRGGAGNATFGMGTNVSDPQPAAAAASARTAGLAQPAASAFRDFVPAPAADRALEVDAKVMRPPAAPDGAGEALRAEIVTRTQGVSTFSLHIGDVSYRLARAALERGQMPDVASIRPEEFYNAFDYGDPAPLPGEAVAGRIEQAAHPFLPGRNLVRAAIKVPAAGRAASQPLRLTVLLDTSGSMERADRVATVRAAFASLASLLGPADRVTLIGFARQARLLAEDVAGDRVAQLADIIARTPSDGGTNLEGAVDLATEKATRSFDPRAQNRIIVLTDGAANLGADDPAQLGTMVERLRQHRIAFDAYGIGVDGLDDSVLEALTRKADGRYYVINSPEEADARFARQLAGAFRPAARDVKVQVRFNPARVRAWRLIGFEQHRLSEQDFRNDRVDAAELAAEEAAVALYQVDIDPAGEGPLGELTVRFRSAATDTIVERAWPLPYEARAAAFDRATPSLRLAGTAALLAEKLRGGAPAGSIRLAELAPVVTELARVYEVDPRVRDFASMFNAARRIVRD